MSNLNNQTFVKPEIYITEADYKTLSALVDSRDDSVPTVALLGDEIDRAIRAEQCAENIFVQIGSVVEYTDLSGGQQKKIQLVLPQDADIAMARISVLTPVGASLIGLTEGSRFEWLGTDKRVRTLEIIKITEPTTAQ
ncbi:GreA/GreB family elongation factor [Hyphococcus lacteus]|uniref:GreA/GreB family elongation factor n=1 Tax=Hyphococcus lacteus TaxID=3143536 RepID=A0ABV3Z1D8_9PROT